ncbi:E3 ubiquitin-protein ligase TRIM71-like [Stylophora pistillata]|uniref:E3 ubiquitin-protein ligase TRIM71-like n=1 Tax=Stylophora pistillata TaxID=50429 RepID=UPI000C04FE09|nr:E3 ubiquitin-protein ligase TRIM71-like [Stylophora pistillata]
MMAVMEAQKQESFDYLDNRAAESMQRLKIQRETGKCLVSVKVNGEHIRDSPFTVEVKPRQFRPVLSFGKFGSGNKDFALPWVKVFSSDGTYLRSFGYKGGKEGELNSPEGIAIDNDDGTIFIADSDDHRIQLFSGKGVFLNKFGEKGNLDHQFGSPCGLSIGSDGNYIVADDENEKVMIFSRTGQFLRSIGSEGSFTTATHCIQKFGTQDGEFDGPTYLSINKAEHLMVSDLRNDRIQVFELNGKFIGKFGTKGKKIGQFDGPSSTAILGDGRILVVDVGNGRVQIIE